MTPFRPAASIRPGRRLALYRETKPRSGTCCVVPFGILQQEDHIHMNPCVLEFGKST